MSTPPVDTRSAAELRAAMLGGHTSAEQVVAGAIARAKSLNGSLNAFIELHEAEAMSRARAVDARLAAAGAEERESYARAHPLLGIPVAVKDNICLQTGRTTCGCRMLRNYCSPFSATAAQRLLDAGAVIIGKTNLDEFGMGSTGRFSDFGATRNPLDPSRSPGGSSSGSAAAVGAGIVPIALGSDTGGSVRQPASYCGVIGLKPSYGRVSRFGLVAYASSLDQIGIISSTVADAAVTLSVISGVDRADSTSVDLPPFVAPQDLEMPPHPLRIAVPREAREASLDGRVRRAFDEAEALLRGAGAHVIDVEMPHASYAVAAYYIIATAEASSNLARFDGVRFGSRTPPEAGDSIERLSSRARAAGFGAEVKRRIMLGTHALSAGYSDAYYGRAMKTRRLIASDYRAAFDRGAQAILMPVAPKPAPIVDTPEDDPLAVYLEDFFTVGVNLAGLPAVAVSLSDASLTPSVTGGAVGVQLVGPAMGEEGLLRIARIIERDR